MCSKSWEGKCDCCMFQRIKRKVWIFFLLLLPVPPHVLFRLRGWTCGSSPRSGSRNAWTLIKNVNGASCLSNIWNFFGAIQLISCRDWWPWTKPGYITINNQWSGGIAAHPAPKIFRVQKSTGKVLASICLRRRHSSAYSCWSLWWISADGTFSPTRNLITMRCSTLRGTFCSLITLATPRQDWTGYNPSRREGGGCGFTLSRSHSCCAVRLVYTQISPGHIWTTLYLSCQDRR